ncbi:MAG: biotin/lipoyl-containing protein [Steroidobacteraceae bacterium]
MSLSAKDVAEILQALEASTFDTLDLELNGVKLKLSRSAGVVLQPAGNFPAKGPDHGSAATTGAAVHAVRIEAPHGTVAVAAPLLGIFYRSPRPGEAAFVEVGNRVEADTNVGIIEVMKLMNTVRAGLRGEVVAIPARNGELVEYGEALLFVRPD